MQLALLAAKYGIHSYRQMKRNSTSAREPNTSLTLPLGQIIWLRQAFLSSRFLFKDPHKSKTFKA